MIPEEKSFFPIKYYADQYLLSPTESNSLSNLGSSAEDLQVRSQSWTAEGQEPSSVSQIQLVSTLKFQLADARHEAQILKHRLEGMEHDGHKKLALDFEERSRSKSLSETLLRAKQSVLEQEELLSEQLLLEEENETSSKGKPGKESESSDSEELNDGVEEEDQEEEEQEEQEEQEDQQEKEEAEEISSSAEEAEKSIRIQELERLKALKQDLLEKKELIKELERAKEENEMIKMEYEVHEF